MLETIFLNYISGGTCCFSFGPIIGPALRSRFKSKFRALVLCTAACTIIVSFASYVLRLRLLDFVFGTFVSMLLTLTLPSIYRSCFLYVCRTREPSSLKRRCGVRLWFHLVCFEYSPIFDPPFRFLGRYGRHPLIVRWSASTTIQGGLM